MANKEHHQTIMRGEAGFSLMEILVSLGLAAIIFGGLAQQYAQSVALSYDSSVRVATILEAQALLQSVGLELRMIGNGVPFDQARFQIGEPTLSDPTVTEPLDVLTATATSLTYRLNETGEVYLLSNNFDPSASLTITLTSVDGLDVNDEVYISNSVVSGQEGLWGQISSVNTGANTITLDGGYVTSAGALFDMGSVLEEVPTVTLTSNANTITRDSGFGSVLMGRNSSLEFEFLDQNGNTVALPLTNASVMNSLRAIRVTIIHTGDRTLKSGDAYSTTVSQVFGVRNLNYVF